MDTMTIIYPENRTWLVLSSCRCRNWMEVGFILHACLSEEDGMAIVWPRATRVRSRPSMSCMNSAIWGTPPNVCACRLTANSTRFESRLPEIRDHVCRSGLYAKAGIALSSTARSSTTSSGSSGRPRTLMHASRKWRIVTSRLICSVDPIPPRQPLS
jgi:hypothetical protein